MKRNVLTVIFGLMIIMAADTVYAAACYTDWQTGTSASGAFVQCYSSDTNCEACVCYDGALQCTSEFMKKSFDNIYPGQYKTGYYAGKACISVGTFGGIFQASLIGLDDDGLCKTTIAGTPTGTGSGTGDIKMVGNVSYSYNGDYLTLSAARIENTRTGGNSGSLKLKLWATAAPYSGGAISGFTIGEYVFPNVLNGKTYYNDVRQTVRFYKPPAGSYYLTLTLTEYNNGNDYITDYRTFDTKATFSNPAPTGNSQPPPSSVPTPVLIPTPTTTTLVPDDSGGGGRVLHQHNRLLTDRLFLNSV